jgi:hypothetical protein
VHSDYEPWTTNRIIIDTAGATPEAAMKSILRAIG